MEEQRHPDRGEAGFMLTELLVVMALLSVELALLAVVVTILYLLFRLAVYPALRRRTEEEIVARAQEETFLMESIRAIR